MFCTIQSLTFYIYKKVNGELLRRAYFKTFIETKPFDEDMLLNRTLIEHHWRWISKLKGFCDGSSDNLSIQNNIEFLKPGALYSFPDLKILIHNMERYTKCIL